MMGTGDRRKRRAVKNHVVLRSQREVRVASLGRPMEARPTQSPLRPRAAPRIGLARRLFQQGRQFRRHEGDMTLRACGSFRGWGGPLVHPESRDDLFISCSRDWLLRIARHTRSGVAGISILRMPTQASASTIALIRRRGRGSAASHPALTPKGWKGRELRDAVRSWHNPLGTRNPERPGSNCPLSGS